MKTGTTRHCRSVWTLTLAVLALTVAGTLPRAASALPPAARPSAALPAEGTPTLVGTSAEARPAQESEAPEEATHGVGFVAGWHGGSGLSYRHYFDGHALQVVFFPAVVADSSSFLWAGLGWSRVIHSWGRRDTRRRELLPGTIGVRMVGGASYRWDREVQDIGDWDSGQQRFSTVRVVTVHHVVHAGTGLGLQLGALGVPGMSIGVDVVLTTEFRDSEFQSLLPLPALEMVYSW